jgi:hypothetical protein
VVPPSLNLNESRVARHKSRFVRFGLGVVARSAATSLASSKLLIRFNDLLHKVVANYVTLVKLDKGDAFDSAGHFQRFDQARLSPGR